ncbi:MAG: ATP-binding protein [Myxococcales bacterium]|nr:ATP-binding protein [Myxococcales bacterium]
MAIDHGEVPITPGWEETLRCELDWLWALLVLRYRQMQRLHLLPPPTERFPGVTIPAAEMEGRILATDPDDDPALTKLEQIAGDDMAQATQKRQTLAARFQKNRELSPLGSLKKLFGLSDVEYLVLLTTIAFDIDPRFSRMFGYLQDHFERQYPTLALISDCLTPPQGALSLRRILEIDAPLRRFALIRLDPKPTSTGWMHTPLLPEPRIVRWVMGMTQLDSPFAPYVTMMRDTDPEDIPFVLDDSAKPEWERLAQAVATHHRGPGLVVYLQGVVGSGRSRWLRETLRTFGKGTLRVAMDALPQHKTEMISALRLLLREAVLQRCVLVFDGWEDLLFPSVSADDHSGPIDPFERALQLSRVFREVLEPNGGVVAFVVNDSTATLPMLSYHMCRFRVPAPSAQCQKVLWEYHVQSRNVTMLADLDFASTTYRLSPGRIGEAVTNAIGSGSGNQAEISNTTLSQAVRETQRHRLGELATILERTYNWNDLVVPNDVDLQLRELISRYRHRSTVLETFGLSRRFGDDLGLSALFDGPPGTGKTMSASLVAKELGLDLYQIDLSRIVDRYVGETEKKLARLFDEAERAQAVLLFDEADSLFSQRTKVQSSNDRYANLEVNFLLQRIERFSGVAILTTNFAESLDTAFTRRLSLRISFPKPDAKERSRLWRAMLSEPRIPKGKIDYDALGDQFELAGGHIRNAVLRASFIAAERKMPLDTRLLNLAAQIELKEQGMLVTGSPIAELWDMTTAGTPGKKA